MSDDSGLTPGPIGDTVSESTGDGQLSPSSASDATHTGRLTFAHRARLKLGMTRVEFADELGVDRFTVYRWERKGVKPLRVFRNKIKEMLR